MNFSIKKHYLFLKTIQKHIIKSIKTKNKTNIKIDMYRAALRGYVSSVIKCNLNETK